MPRISFIFCFIATIKSIHYFFVNINFINIQMQSIKIENKKSTGISHYHKYGCATCAIVDRATSLNPLAYI